MTPSVSSATSLAAWKTPTTTGRFSQKTQSSRNKLPVSTKQHAFAGVLSSGKRVFI